MAKEFTSSVTEEQIIETKMFDILCNHMLQREALELILQITQMKPDEWFTPSPNTPLYNVYGRLFGLNLVARQKIPVWKKGRFDGHRLRFLYNLDLNY